MSLEHLDVGGAGATWTLSEREGHLLALLEIFEASALDGRAVEEQILVSPVSDEAESLVGDQLDLALPGTGGLFGPVLFSLRFAILRLSALPGAITGMFLSCPGGLMLRRGVARGF